MLPTLARIFVLVFGTLYPAYASYKAVKTKNVREYVKWMMYWIVFALFTAVETFADIFISWVPFYYEIKILFVIWLLSPATKGSSILYRKVVHPNLVRREKDIDEYIAKATDRGCAVLLDLGSRGFTLASAAIVNTAVKGQSTLVDHLKRSYSMNDLSEPQPMRRQPSIDVEPIDETDNRFNEEDEFTLRDRQNLDISTRKRHTYTDGYSEPAPLTSIGEEKEANTAEKPDATQSDNRSTTQGRSYSRRESKPPNPITTGVSPSRIKQTGTLPSTAEEEGSNTWRSRFHYWR